MAFREDLRKGKRGEDILSDILRNAGYEPKPVSKNNREEFDLSVNVGSRHVFFECKYDEYATKSGNLAFEYSKPKGGYSGVMMTTADLWCQIIPYPKPKVLVIPLWPLLAMVCNHAGLWCMRPDKSGKKCLRVAKGVGDGNANIVLYKLEEIEDMFVNFNTMTSEEIKSYLDKVELYE